MQKRLYTGLLLLSLLFSFYGIANAQEPDWLWAKSMGGTGFDTGNSIAPDPSGNGDVYATGQFEGTVDFDPGFGTFNITSGGGPDIFISKLDGSGNLLWAKAMGGIKLDGGYSIAVDPAGSGDVYITGYFQGTVDFDPGAGIFNLTATGATDLFISKLDGTGNLLWAKAMGGSTYLYSNSIAVDPAGSGAVYTTGRFNETVDFDPGTETFNLTAAGDDIFISKLDGSGNFLWVKAFGASGVFDVGNSIAIDPAGSGDVFATGKFQGTVDFDPGAGTFNLTAVGNQSIFISRLDSSGNFVWAKTMGGPNNIYGSSIAIDPTGIGSVYTTGIFNGTVDFDPGAGVFNLTAGGFDIFISKLNGSGNFVWAKAMGGSGFDHGVSIAVDPAGSGDIYTIGNFKGTADFDPGAATFNLTSAGGSDIFISKLDGTGNFAWAKLIGGKNDDYGNTLALDALGHVYVAGQFNSSSISLDSLTINNASTIGGITFDMFIAKLDIILSGTESRENNMSVSLFPNPATGTVQFDFGDNPVEPFYLTLTDAVGRVVISKKMLDKELDVSYLQPGLYFMKIQNGERMGTAKLLKQ